MPEEFSVERRNHPWGEQGVRSSLDEVAKRATEGAVRPEVRTWAIECLDKARKQGKRVSSDKGRAETILKACQDKLWVPDPVFAEYIPPARLLACAKHGDNDSVCIKGDDCDGLVTLCAGAFMSVGLHTLVVGHGYGSHRTIQHVLTAVRIGDKWYYADPSTPETRSALPLGECIPFTRERLIAMPNLKVICDDNVCLTNDGTGFDPNAMQFVDQGVFIGINGAPREVRGLPFGKRLRWLGRGEGRATRILTKQGLEQDGGSTRKLTATDKIALAGVLLSAAALAYQFSRE